MSRRKQSNPKPIKRPEDEEEEADVTQEMDQSKDSVDTGEDQLDNTSETEGMEPDNEQMDCEQDMNTERELTPPVAVKQEVPDESDIKTEEGDSGALLQSHDIPLRPQLMGKCFPVDLLTLRKVEESEFLVTGMPWSVSSAVTLTKGRSIGPYQGELIALSSIKPGELVLQFQGKDGELTFIKVTEEAGTWLSLLRPGEHSAAHNTCVYYEDGKIWCEILEDLVPGTELVASFTVYPSGQSSSPKPESTERGTSGVQPGAKKHDQPKSIPQLSPQHALIYGCPFCSVRFSSPRTLEGHLTYYCSKKPADFVSLQQLHQRLEQQAQAAAAAAIIENQAGDRPPSQHSTPSPAVKSEQMSPKPAKRSVDDISDASNSDAGSPQSKSPKSGEVFKCSSCSYVSDKLSSLQRHQRIHGRSTPGDSPVCQEEMFCKDCNIQFSSMSTYRGHKEFYCQYRHRQSSGSEDNISETAKTAARESIKSPNVAIDTKGQIVPNKTGIYPGLLVPGLQYSPLLLQAMNKDMHFFLKGHQQAGEVISPGSKSPIEESAAKTVKSTHSSSEDQPLDLSKSKSSSEAENDVKSDSDRESQRPDSRDRHSIKSEPRSPPQLSPATKKPKLELDEKYEALHSSLKATLNIPAVPTILGTNQVQFVNKKPIPPLQMVSRCVECNIVFYKHENYLIHKEHYCSGRRAGKDSSSAESDTSETDAKDPEVAAGAKAETKTELENRLLSKIKHPSGESSAPEVLSERIPQVTEMAARYFCIPCKIRFSSAGNLKAHKDFYCPHGKENDINAAAKDSNKVHERQASDSSCYRCDTCKNDFTSARLLKLHICMGETSPSPLLRCLYCDYVTQTEHRLSEHMKVHVPTKAFKCNLCGYRGNTARGMRMHGKVHMENGEEFTDDNMIEYEEPPLVPIQRNGFCEKGPVDMETELIRMKNEPYKRRRSRKSFEKSENMVPFIGQNLLTQICAACGQTFGNVSDFVIHLRMHEIAALEAMKNSKGLRCEHCNDFIADSLTSLLVHMQTKHPEQLPGTSKGETVSEGERSQSRDSQGSNVRSRSGSVESNKTTTSLSSHENRNVRTNSPGCRSDLTQSDQNGEVKVKVEGDGCSEVKHRSNSINNDTIEHSFNGIRSLESKDLEDTNKSHTSGEVSKKSESPRSQSSPLNPVENGSLQKISSPTGNHTSSPSNGEPALDLSPKNNSSSSSSPQPTLSPNHNDQNHLSPKLTSIKSENNIISPKRLSPDPKTRYLLSQNIKKEQVSPPIDHAPKRTPPPTSPRTPSASPKISSPLLPHSPTLQNLPLLYSRQAMLPLYQFPGGIPPSFIPSPGVQPPQASPGEKNGRKYCKHCDINFTYLSSFLTHKKYYCSARSSADESESPTATA